MDIKPEKRPGQAHCDHEWVPHDTWGTYYLCPLCGAWGRKSYKGLRVKRCDPPEGIETVRPSTSRCPSLAEQEKRYTAKIPDLLDGD
jgi:hypothetical protein